ncbi:MULTISPECIES: helix-turn-helix domain-containing protein [unclassified Enterococcus]|uniref:helix-turn-helix domain-containing protein n=1 Tax=unclassified Enterococcus TaxID=2608891 RepID=UPI00259B5367|nr:MULTISPECIES: helix-turn-helix domain-containing protein [unclassified Enterococcus]MDO0919956.1 helix-turn-helix domain-containing protein [Enterococcus sp. B1E2]WIV15427.1 helix-turn-helix domain-containing protein [Enterococcus sp. FZMF]
MLFLKRFKNEQIYLDFKVLKKEVILIKSKTYLNKKQTCDFLGIDNNTLDKWIKQYHFPVIRINGIIRFDIEDIKEFMNTFKTL